MNDKQSKNDREADKLSDYVIELLQKYMIICSCDDGETFLVPSMLKKNIAELEKTNDKLKLPDFSQMVPKICKT